MNNLAPDTQTNNLSRAFQVLSSTYDKNGTRHCWTFAEFAEQVRLGLAEGYPSKDAMVNVVPAELGDQRNEKGNLAHNANVRTVSCIGVDYDDGNEAVFAAALANLGYSAFWYGSPSDGSPDTNGAPRVKRRIFIETDRSLVVHELNPIRDWLVTSLGITHDPNARNESRVWYVGKIEGTPDRAFGRLEGEPLPVDSVLRLAPAPAPSMRERAERNQSGTETDGHDHAAVISLLTPYYTEHHKHAVALGLAGYYSNRGYTLADAERVIEALPSDNVDARLQDASDAFTQHTPAGWSKLAEHLTAEALSQLEALAPDRSERAQMVSQVRMLPIEQPSAPQSAANDGLNPPWPMPARNETRSDLGNSRRLVRLHGADLRYCEARGGWYAWDSTRWRYDDTGASHRAAKASADTLWDYCKNLDEDWRKFAASSLNRNRIEAALKLAQSEPGVPVTVDMLDADPWLLNVQNGTLDLRTGELRQPDRSLLMTKACAAPYVAGARSELWDRFVDTLTAGDRDLAAYLQRAIGYALFGEWREKAFWFGYGPPDGGKSTILGVVGDVLGDYHVSAAASTWMIQHNVGGNRGDITRLLGARLVTTLEIRPGLRFDPEIMKKVTGGDLITAAAKFENEIEFRPRFGLWFGANDRPTIPDDDEGFWNRVRCVPFTNVIPPERQDKHLRAKLTNAEHAPAVLAWAVAGCLSWQREGIGSCAAVEAATRTYRRDMNRAAGFFDECCELAPTAAVGAPALRARYEQWCRDNGVQRPLQGKAWRSRMLALGATGGDDSSRVNGQRVWCGIRLKPD